MHRDCHQRALFMLFDNVFVKPFFNDSCRHLALPNRSCLLYIQSDLLDNTSGSTTCLGQLAL